MAKGTPQFDDEKETVGAKADFLSQLPATFGIGDIHDGLLTFFDSLLGKAGITDADSLGKLARLRSQIDIALKDF